MSNQKNPNWAARWKGATIIAAVTIFLDLSVLFLGTHNIYNSSLSIPWSVGSIGIITFVGILLHVNYLSNDTELSKREMRKAIAASLIAVYCTLVPLIIFELPNFTNDKQFELATTAIAYFSWVIGAVIVFYFGSRSVDKWVDYKKEEQAQSGVTAVTASEGVKAQKLKEESPKPQVVKPQEPSNAEDTHEQQIRRSENEREWFKAIMEVIIKGAEIWKETQKSPKDKIKEEVEVEIKAKEEAEELGDLKKEEGSKVEESSSAGSK